MAFVVKLLAVKATNAGGNTGLYTASAPASGAIVNNIRFVNTQTTNGTVNLFYKKSGGSQLKIMKQETVTASYSFVVTPEITLGQGDALEATTSVAMDCVVSGVEKVGS